MNYTFFMHDQGNETEIRHWQWWWLGAMMSVLCGVAILMAIRSISSPLEGKSEMDLAPQDEGDRHPGPGGQHND